MRKYDLDLNDSIKVGNRVLYRVIYTDEFCEKFKKWYGWITFNKKGGYVESKKNLSQDGFAVITENAMVYDNGKVIDDARVEDNSIVEGNAVISLNSIVRGSTIINDYIKVSSVLIAGQALISGNAEISG